MSKKFKTKRHQRDDQIDFKKLQKHTMFPNTIHSKQPSVKTFRQFQKNQQHDPDAMQIQTRPPKDPDAMQIQARPPKDPDAMQIQSIPRQIPRLITNDNKKKMTHILQYFHYTNGHINRLLKYVMGDTSIGMNRCSETMMDFAENCSLSSQCYSTTQLMNYFFGTPTMKIITNDTVLSPSNPGTTIGEESAKTILEFVYNDLHENQIINMNISVSSTPNGFPGHIFNILFLKQDGKLSVFVVQSFIYSYTFFYNIVPVGFKHEKTT